MMSIGFKLAENVFKRNSPVTKSELGVLNNPDRACFFDRLLDICLHNIDDFKTEPNFDQRNIQLRMHHIRGLNRSLPPDPDKKNCLLLNHGLDNVSAHHVCHRPLNELCEVYIQDLLKWGVGVIHKGKYIELKMSEDCFRISGICALAEDKRGDAITLVIYNFIELRASKGDTRKLFPKGVKITLKEPYVKLTASGFIGLRVDNPSNIIIHYSWMRPYLTPLELKEEGNEFISTDLPKAYKLYSMALECKSDDDLRLACLNNRALVSLRANDYHLALKDCNAALLINGTNIKARLRKAMALLGLHRPEEAFDLLNGLQEHSSEIGTTLTQALNRARTNINQRRGVFDFDTLPFDHMQQEEICDYLGPLEVRMTRNRGRGLFLTKNVKAGDLLLVEKAHAFGVANEDVVFMASDMATGKVLNFQQEELCSRLTILCNTSSYHNSKLAILSSSIKNKSTLPDLNGILIGEFPTAPLLSVAEVQGIVSINSFAIHFNANATPAMRKTLSQYSHFLSFNYNQVTVYDDNGKPGFAMIVDPQNEIMLMACDDTVELAEAIKRASKDDLNCQSPDDKDTALIYAIHGRNEIGAIMLIRAGADVNLANRLGMTPLHYAAGQFANVRIVKCLIEHGAEVNARSIRLVTPLHAAVYMLFGNLAADIQMSTRVVELLLDHGADPFAIDHDLRSVVDIAFGKDIFHAFTQRAIVPIDYKPPPLKKGCGLWIISSFMNHSKRCNTARKFVGKLMLVYALEDMKKGTEITTWYGDDPVMLRKWGIVA